MQLFAMSIHTNCRRVAQHKREWEGGFGRGGGQVREGICHGAGSVSTVAGCAQCNFTRRRILRQRGLVMAYGLVIVTVASAVPAEMVVADSTFEICPRLSNLLQCRQQFWQLNYTCLDCDLKCCAFVNNRLTSRQLIAAVCTI